MKKIFAVFVFCSHAWAMDSSIYETRLSKVETSVSEIQNILNDKQDPDDATAKIPGLITKVQDAINDISNVKTSVDAIQQSTISVSTGMSSLSATVSNLSTQIGEIQATVTDINTRMNNIDASIDEKMKTSWEVFIENKFQEYMKEKKKVLDIITACKIKGISTPTYIMETSEQLQLLSLDVRRSTLSEILTKFNVFATLLDNDQLEIIQTYFDNTNVPKPQLKPVNEIMQGVIIEGEYLKVSGATRTFTRSSGFKTGLPKQRWMDPNCDYFAYGLRPILEQAINQENLGRRTSNAAIEKENALAQAAYDSGIHAAERATFPADDLTSLINDYNRLLTCHEI